MTILPYGNVNIKRSFVRGASAYFPLIHEGNLGGCYGP